MNLIYQAAVSYDARRRLMGTALVQHFMDQMEPNIRLIGLWCAQDIEANEFWNACGFEAIAARHGSRRKGRVHIFWVGKTAKGKHEQLRYPKQTRGGLMREHREVFGLKPGEEYKEVVLPELASEGIEASRHEGTKESGSRARRPCHRPKADSRRPKAEGRQPSLSAMQRAFRYGQGNHICVVIAGATKYLPVAPFEMPNFTDLARVMAPSAGAVGPGAGAVGPGAGANVGLKSQRVARPSTDLWTPAA